MALSDAQLKKGLADIPHWGFLEGQIVRQLTFKDFSEALGFVNQVGDIAEKANHHPDIVIQWNRVTLTLFTHDARALTEKDLELAKRIDQLLDS